MFYDRRKHFQAFHHIWSYFCWCLSTLLVMQLPWCGMERLTHQSTTANNTIQSTCSAQYLPFSLFVIKARGLDFILYFLEKNLTYNCYYLFLFNCLLFIFTLFMKLSNFSCNCFLNLLLSPTYRLSKHQQICVDV